MVVVWKTQPLVQVIVTHSATPYTLDAGSIIVRRHENGFDTATVLLEDDQAKNYVDKVAADDTIEIKQKDRSEGSWTTIFKGIIRRVEPSFSSERGNLLNVECDGAGYGLDAAKCGEEYGTESSNSTLDTIREMVKDAGNGIIPLWVNKILGSAVNSGYSYTTYVEDIAGSMRYFYFPFKPCSKTINDICDVLQAIKGAAAGPHWIVDTSSHFLLTTIGAHSAAGDNPAQYWPTWWRTDRDGSTLEEGKDFLNFRGEQLAKDANYILYHGATIKPLKLDDWTNGAAASWGSSFATVANDAASYKIGSDSIHITENTGGVLHVVHAYYPSTLNMGLNISGIGGMYNVPILHFWSKVDADCYNNNENVFFTLYTTDIVDYYEAPATTIGCQAIYPAADRWIELTLPIGPYSKHYKETAPDWFDEWIIGLGAPTWNAIDAVGMHWSSNTNTQEIWFDGIYIKGAVLRGAYDAAISATNPLKLKVITDDVAKDDTWKASDDSGTIGRLAYAEYLRRSSTPIVATFTTLIANDALPGQLIHVHTKKKSDGSFRIDKDFRVTRLVHSVSEQGCLTFWSVTDDVLNANPRPIPTQLNTLLAAVRPEFQDRQASSIKTREIDITQTILEKSY